MPINCRAINNTLITYNNVMNNTDFHLEFKNILDDCLFKNHLVDYFGVNRPSIFRIYGKYIGK